MLDIFPTSVHCQVYMLMDFLLLYQSYIINFLHFLHSFISLNLHLPRNGPNSPAIGDPYPYTPWSKFKIVTLTPLQCSEHLTATSRSWVNDYIFSLVIQACLIGSGCWIWRTEAWYVRWEGSSAGRSAGCFGASNGNWKRACLMQNFRKWKNRLTESTGQYLSDLECLLGAGLSYLLWKQYLARSKGWSNQSRWKWGFMKHSIWYPRQVSSLLLLASLATHTRKSLVFGPPSV